MQERARANKVMASVHLLICADCLPYKGQGNGKKIACKNTGARWVRGSRGAMAFQ